MTDDESNSFGFSASLVVQWFKKKKKICLPVKETWVQSQSQEDPLEEEMAAHSGILAWEIPCQKSRVGYRPWSRKSQTRLSD